MTDAIAISNLIKAILQPSSQTTFNPLNVLQSFETAKYVWITLQSDTTKEAIARGVVPFLQQEPFDSEAHYINSYSDFVIRVFESHSDLKSLCEGLGAALKRIDLTNEDSVRFHIMILKRAFSHSLKKSPTTRTVISSIINDTIDHFEFANSFHIEHYTFLVTMLQSVLTLTEESGGPPVEHENKRSFTLLKLDSLHAENVVSESSIPFLLVSIINLPQQYVRIKEYRTCTESAEVNYYGMGWDCFAHICYLFCAAALLVYGVDLLISYHQDLHHGAVKVLSLTGTVLSFNHLALQSSIPHLNNVTVIPCFVASFVVLIQKVLNPELFD